VDNYRHLYDSNINDVNNMFCSFYGCCVLVSVALPLALYIGLYVYDYDYDYVFYCFCVIALLCLRHVNVIHVLCHSTWRINPVSVISVTPFIKMCIIILVARLPL